MKSRSLLQIVSEVQRALVREGDAALQPLGLRCAQIPVLALLLARPGATQKILAEASGMEQPSMAQLLARMDRDGLIHRAPHPNDARKRLVTLTDPHDPRLGEGNERLAQLQRRALAGFDDAEIDVLTTLLNRPQDNLARPGKRSSAADVDDREPRPDQPSQT